MDTDRIIIGITGAFGSGCTTVAEYLKEEKGYEYISLSGLLKKIASDKGAPFDTREEKQAFGNQVRNQEGLDFLSQKACEIIEESDKDAKDQGQNRKNIVVECFRNLAEVEFFQRHFYDFYLIAICSPFEQRWMRSALLYKDKGLCKEDFVLCDKNDQKQSMDYGQNVKGCVRMSDIIINNAISWQTDTDRINYFHKINGYIENITECSSSPIPDECLMDQAYAVSFQSDCIGRQVGAVITNENNEIISVGYNKAPGKGKSCLVKYKKCYRDIRKENLFLESDFEFCPKCGKKIENKIESYNCTNTECNVNLVETLFASKELDYCRAIHAEEKAILDIPKVGKGISLKGCTIYSTTLPCNLCAKKIAEVGIKKVVYVEPYPVKETLEVFTENEIKLIEFEGIKARAYHRIYMRRSKYIEKQSRELAAGQVKGDSHEKIMPKV